MYTCNISCAVQGTEVRDGSGDPVVDSLGVADVENGDGMRGGVGELGGMLP
jgi:hypothetical protein